MLGIFNISASGLSAQRLRMDIIADNIANASTVRPPGEVPYQRRYPLFAAKQDNSFAAALQRSTEKVGQGVRVVAILEDNVTPGELVYQPEHPYADEQGYIRMPNVNIMREMVNMISASRAYEANVTALNATKAMVTKALEIGR
ncbi:MAG TPA: flagellar basal body rod protein FlgC [Firmicutes bacterium]|jgi:flagellar basal-body rod protein FlgC|nr:flagellar basal body rod protein FlgC [Bacillota bacterium]